MGGSTWALGPGQPTAQVAVHPAEVESLQHPARIRAAPERPRNRFARATLAPMSLDTAQLSSLSTALDELTAPGHRPGRRVPGLAREDVAADLYEVERNLQAAARRLQALLAAC